MQEGSSCLSGQDAWPKTPNSQENRQLKRTHLSTKESNRIIHPAFLALKSVMRDEVGFQPHRT